MARRARHLQRVALVLAVWLLATAVAACTSETSNTSAGHETSTPPRIGTPVRVVEGLEYAAGRRLDAYVPTSRPSGQAPSARLPVVVLLHGCCGDRSDLGKLAEALAEAGAVVINADWPGTDRDARFPDAYQAVSCVVRFARARAVSLGGDADRIVLVGWSDGAMAAAAVAGSARRFEGGGCPFPSAPGQPRAVVGLNGFYGWPLPVPSRYATPGAMHFLGGSPVAAPDAWRAATPYAVLGTSPRGGTLLLVGSTDALVPDARRYEAALRGAGRPVRLVELRPAGDQTLISPRSPEGRRVVTEVLFLARHLDGAAASP